MYRAMIIAWELGRMRQEQEWRPEPLALELPLPVDRPRSEADETPREETSRGVVIIDMNDYTEVESI